MADAAAAAAPPGGNDVNGNNANHQPTSPRRALKITILVILLIEAGEQRCCIVSYEFVFRGFDNAVVMDQALMMAGCAEIGSESIYRETKTHYGQKDGQPAVVIVTLFLIEMHRGI
eukprot:scaffold9089_cov209-Skeletonema_dohrnii-CCMP3373.AAC.1